MKIHNIDDINRMEGTMIIWMTLAIAFQEPTKAHKVGPQYNNKKHYEIQQPITMAMANVIVTQVCNLTILLKLLWHLSKIVPQSRSLPNSLFTN